MVIYLRYSVDKSPQVNKIPNEIYTNHTSFDISAYHITQLKECIMINILKNDKKIVSS